MSRKKPAVVVVLRIRNGEFLMFHATQGLSIKDFCTKGEAGRDKF